MKKIFLLLIVVLLSGCTVNYNLVIDVDNIVEDVNITVPINEDEQDIFEDQVSYDRPVYFGQSIIYEVDANADDNNYYANYKYKHKVDNFSKSSFLNTCYSNNDIQNTDDQISILTSNRFDCINMADGVHADEVTINITTGLRVKKHNADKVNGQTYTWIINEDNYQNKPINMILKKESIEKDVQNFIDTIPNKEMICICLLLLVSAIIIYAFIKRKYNEKNEI